MCSSTIHTYSLINDNLERSDLIKRYCELGFKHKEVLLFVLKHSCIMEYGQALNTPFEEINKKPWHKKKDKFIESKRHLPL